MLQHVGTCVIADDTPHMRLMLERWLSELGFKCLACSNAIEALREIEQQEPELVITDVDMPLGDGLQLLAALRKHATPSLRQTPVVVVSSMIDADMEQVIQDRGGNAFVAKPIAKHSFLLLVQQVLDRCRVSSWVSITHPIAKHATCESFRRIVANNPLERVGRSRG